MSSHKCFIAYYDTAFIGEFYASKISKAAELAFTIICKLTSNKSKLDDVGPIPETTFYVEVECENDKYEMRHEFIGTRKPIMTEISTPMAIQLASGEFIQYNYKRSIISHYENTIVEVHNPDLDENNEGEYSLDIAI